MEFIVYDGQKNKKKNDCEHFIPFYVANSEKYIFMTTENCLLCIL